MCAKGGEVKEGEKGKDGEWGYRDVEAEITQGGEESTGGKGSLNGVFYAGVS